MGTTERPFDVTLCHSSLVDAYNAYLIYLCIRGSKKPSYRRDMQVPLFDHREPLGGGPEQNHASPAEVISANQELLKRWGTASQTERNSFTEGLIQSFGFQIEDGALVTDYSFSLMPNPESASLLLGERGEERIQGTFGVGNSPLFFIHQSARRNTEYGIEEVKNFGTTSVPFAVYTDGRILLDGKLMEREAIVGAVEQIHKESRMVICRKGYKIETTDQGRHRVVAVDITPEERRLEQFGTREEFDGVFEFKSEVMTKADLEERAKTRGMELTHDISPKGGGRLMMYNHTIPFFSSDEHLFIRCPWQSLRGPYRSSGGGYAVLLPDMRVVSEYVPSPQEIQEGRTRKTGGI